MVRLVVEHGPHAPRTPFVLLVLALLGGGLVGLLLLSSASSADAFTQRKLQQDNRELTLREQELGREVAALEAPRAIASRARAMGLVPAAAPGFLVVEPDGRTKVVGSPVPATSPPPPPKPTPTPTPTPSGSAAGRPPPSPTPGTPTPTPGGTR